MPANKVTISVRLIAATATIGLTATLLGTAHAVPGENTTPADNKPATNSQPADKPAKPAKPAVDSAAYAQALAALPNASRNLTTATTAYTQAQQAATQAQQQHATILTQLTTTQTAQTQAQTRYNTANTRHTQALQAANNAQQQVDATARTMYINGGQPTMIEMVLTANEPDSFAYAVETSQALENVSTEHINTNTTAQTELDTATAELETAQTELNTANSQLATIQTQANTALTAVNTANSQLAEAETAYNTAQTEYQRLWDLTSVNPSVDYEPITSPCADKVVGWLYDAGFRGEDLREAWSIVMRESSGNPKAVSATNDLCLFQINTAAWQGQPWFDRELLLTPEYGAKIGYMLSQGGRTWYPWGLDGRGKVNAQVYRNVGWTDEMIQERIIDRYLVRYRAYPLDPSNCPTVAAGTASEKSGKN